ncbi:Serine--tRNA ligase [bacterium HR19]|nr:Serine--tRNA ligase [bacterium HR19]
MINPDLIKKNPDLLRENIRKRESNFDVELLIEKDMKRREIQMKIDSLRHELNSITDKIAELTRKNQNAEELKRKAKEIREEIKKCEEERKSVDAEWQNLILNYPNIVHESIPEKEPKIIKTWGEPKKEEFHIPHWEIGEKLKIMSEEKGAKLSGSGFTVMQGDGALLERALINFMLDTHTKNGYREIFTPYLVREEIMEGTGHLPKFAYDMYQIEKDNLWLIPTAEVTLVNLFREEIIPEDELTINCVAYSACFRREAGSWGRETRGIIRQHQFNKVELVKISKPEQSYDELENLVKDACRILELLNLPYRVVLLPANDMGFSASKTYDIEVWMPGLGKFVEISSCSNCEDFQARRAMIRLRRKNGKVEYVHTLNGSGVAIGRCLAAILENYLQKDGTVKVPPALTDYMKKSFIGK